jgi:hypothetical protein
LVFLIFFLDFFIPIYIKPPPLFFFLLNPVPGIEQPHAW